MIEVQFCFRTTPPCHCGQPAEYVIPGIPHEADCPLCEEHAHRQAVNVPVFKVKCEDTTVAAMLPGVPPNRVCETCKKPVLDGSSQLLGMIKAGARMQVSMSGKVEAIPAERA